MTSPILKFVSLSQYDLSYGTEHSAGIDIPYYDPTLETVTLLPGCPVKLPTGIFVEIPENHFGHFDTRSSTAKRGILMSCGTIDSDYRGELRLCLINVGNEPQTISRGDVLAHMIVLPYTRVTPIRVGSVSEFSETSRGSSGFGSTGASRKV